MCWGRQEFGLIDLGPYLGVICRVGDSWLACTSLKAAWPPPTDLETCLNLMPEIPCSTSVGFQRLLVFMLSRSDTTSPDLSLLFLHFFHPSPQPSLLFTPHCFYTVEMEQLFFSPQSGGTVLVYLTWFSLAHCKCGTIVLQLFVTSSGLFTALFCYFGIIMKTPFDFLGVSKIWRSSKYKISQCDEEKENVSELGKNATEEK